MPLGKPMLDALDRMSFGGVLLDAEGRALLINRTAQHLLAEGTRASPAREDDLEWVRNAVKGLLHAGTARFRMSEDNWVMVPREGQRPLALHALLADTIGNPGANTLLILADLESAPEPSPTVLQKMFDLTPTEAKIAIQIARGDRPSDVAKELGVKVGTVRFHLSSVLAKTQTKRQSELVALLARVSILP